MSGHRLSEVYLEEGLRPSPGRPIGLKAIVPDLWRDMIQALEAANRAQFSRVPYAYGEGAPSAPGTT